MLYVAIDVHKRTFEAAVLGVARRAKRLSVVLVLRRDPQPRRQALAAHLPRAQNHAHRAGVASAVSSLAATPGFQRRCFVARSDTAPATCLLHRLYRVRSPRSV
jgi:hypothetical protein